MIFVRLYLRLNLKVSSNFLQRHPQHWLVSEQGYVTFNDLKQILKMLSIKLPDEKVREMMVEASSAGDDRVTFDDFRYMYFC